MVTDSKIRSLVVISEVCLIKLVDPGTPKIFGDVILLKEDILTFSEQRIERSLIDTDF